MVRSLLLLGSLTALLGSTGCATIIRGTSQTLELISDPPRARVTLSTGEQCVTPCQIIVKRNQSGIAVFEKPECKRTARSFYPIIGAGGCMLVGLIDYVTGAVFTVTPNPLMVILDCKKQPLALKRSRATGTLQPYRVLRTAHMYPFHSPDIIEHKAIQIVRF